jgi:hypothetical protein
MSAAPMANAKIDAEAIALPFAFFMRSLVLRGKKLVIATERKPA